MTKRRAIPLFGVLLLAAAGVALALYLTNKRDVTTSSDEAYRVYREAVENERRFYVKEAQAGFAKALELDPEFAMAMAGLARYAERDRSLALLKQADRLRSRLSERERLQIDLQLAMREKGPEAALKVARQILAAYPNDFRSASIVAHHEKAVGNHEEALRVFRRLLEADPNSADAYNMIGYYHGFRGDYERAIESLKKYQFMAPDQANPHDSLGEIQAYSGRYDEAIESLNRALRVKPDFFAAYDHLGVAYEGKGDPAKAREHFRKAAELSPLDKDGYLFKALRTTFYDGNREAFREITADLAKLPASDYSDRHAAFVKACELLLAGRPAEAEAALVELRPRLEAHFREKNQNARLKYYEPAWNFLTARARIAQGKDAQAIPLLEEMASPPNPWEAFEGRLWVYQAKAQLAVLLAKRGELDRAEKLLEENHRWNPSWAPTRPAEQTVAQLRRAKVLAAAK